MRVNIYKAYSTAAITELTGELSLSGERSLSRGYHQLTFYTTPQIQELLSPFCKDQNRGYEICTNYTAGSV